VTNIIVELEDAVGTLTIARRERFNSLDVETARDLRKAGLQLARDENVRAVVLRGAGGASAAGGALGAAATAGAGYRVGRGRVKRCTRNPPAAHASSTRAMASAVGGTPGTGARGPGSVTNWR